MTQTCNVIIKISGSMPHIKEILDFLIRILTTVYWTGKIKYTGNKIWIEYDLFDNMDFDFIKNNLISMIENSNSKFEVDIEVKNFINGEDFYVYNDINNNIIIKEE